MSRASARWREPSNGFVSDKWCRNDQIASIPQAEFAMMLTGTTSCRHRADNVRNRHHVLRHRSSLAHPDTTYLKQNRSMVRAIVLTHGQ